MILVFDGTPSSGGPRCLRSRGARDLPVLDGSTSRAPSVPGAAVRASLVVEVKGAAWPGTLVGPVPLVVGSTTASPSAAVSPSLFLRLRWEREARPPRPRPRPRVDERRRGLPSAPSAPSAGAAAGSGLRASWTETLRSRMVLPLSSLIARSASDGVDTSTKA